MPSFSTSVARLSALSVSRSTSLNAVNTKSAPGENEQHDREHHELPLFVCAAATPLLRAVPEGKNDNASGAPNAHDRDRFTAVK